MAREPDLLKALMGVQVLVVDRDREARTLLDAVLTYCGAFVTLVATARDALARLDRPVDVVIAEVGLPGEDGYWLLRQIRGRVPVVALATRPGDSLDRTLAAGFSGHVRKPVDPWELCRIVAGLARKA